MQQIAARRGLRPVAKALGAAVGDTYSRGTGSRLARDSSRTRRYIVGCCASLTGYARMTRRAIRSLANQA